MVEKLTVIFLLVQLFVVAAFDTTLSAQTTKSSKKSTRTLVMSDTRPFSYTIVDDLPPYYIGHSYGELLSALTDREKVATKGEYESTFNYKVRMAKFNERPIIGTTNYRSRFAFTFLPNEDQFAMKYDPDISEMDITVTWTNRIEFGGYSTPYSSLTWSESSRKVGSYIGRNAFNLALRVSVYRNDSYYLVTELPNLEKIGQKIASFTLDSPVYMSFKKVALSEALRASIRIPPSDARLAKINLRILVIGRLAEKSVLYRESRDTPDITDPYDRYNFDHAINLAVEEIWLYDYKTGKVYVRFGADRSEGVSPYTSNPAVEIAEDDTDKDKQVPSPSPTPKTISETVFGGVLNSQATSLPNPAYPPAARAVRAGGAVSVQVLISESGSVISARAVSGHPLLRAAAASAARGARFGPAVLSGQPVKISGVIIYEFVP